MPEPNPLERGGAGPRIAVCGPGSAAEPLLGLAEEVGVRLANAGATVVCGGLGGVMEAVARGAAGRGGFSIGVLPGRSAADANRFITLPLPTGMGEMRNLLVVRFADAVIAVGGGWGTLSEVAFALKIDRPVVLLQPTHALGPTVRTAATAAEAVRLALEAAGGRTP